MSSTQLSEDEPIRVSVCIAAYNEEGIIAETVAEAVEVLTQVPGRHEILIVNDGSSDRTGEILAELAAREPMLRPLTHPENRGNPAGQRTLVAAARGEYIFHIGADRQWRMAEIPKMLAKLEQGYDMVIGIRRDKQYTPWRKLVSACYNNLVAVLWGKHFGDLGSLKLVRSSLWKRVPFLSDSAFIHAQRVIIAHANGARIATVPVEHLARTRGKSSFSHPSKAIEAAIDLIKFRLSPDWRQDIGPWRDG